MLTHTYVRVAGMPLDPRDQCAMSVRVFHVQEVWVAFCEHNQLGAVPVVHLHGNGTVVGMSTRKLWLCHMQRHASKVSTVSTCSTYSGLCTAGGNDKAVTAW